MESDVVTLQDIYEFKLEGIDRLGKVVGRLTPTGLRPSFEHKFRKHGIELPADLFTPAYPRAVS